MRSGNRLGLPVALVLLVLAASARADTLSLVHQQRYAMGTMFDIIVYHSSRPDAERSIERAMDEIVRLDQVMSHYKADSNLSKLNREGGSGFIVVEPSLYEVIKESIWFSQH
jgi:FAD:protein FMN transferase